MPDLARDDLAPQRTALTDERRIAGEHALTAGPPLTLLIRGGRRELTATDHADSLEPMLVLSDAEQADDEGTEDDDLRDGHWQTLLSGVIGGRYGLLEHGAGRVAECRRP